MGRQIFGTHMVHRETFLQIHMHVKILVNDDWMLSQLRATSLRRSDPTVLGTAKPKHRKSILWPVTRGRDVPKGILKEFTIVSLFVCSGSS